MRGANGMRFERSDLLLTNTEYPHRLPPIPDLIFFL